MPPNGQKLRILMTNDPMTNEIEAASLRIWSLGHCALVIAPPGLRLTMLAIVLITLYGIRFVRLGKLERYTHALAGAMILLSVAAIAVLGL